MNKKNGVLEIWNDIKGLRLEENIKTCIKRFKIWFKMLEIIWMVRKV